MGNYADAFHDQLYTHPQSGLTYHVAYYNDYDMRAPHKEHDGHGVVETLSMSAEDAMDSEYATDELRMRLPLFRELVSDRGDYLYYDVIASINNLVTVWGIAPEIAAEEADRDYEYLRGWYRGDWHWMYITLTKLDEDGEETTDCTSCGGYESMLLDDEQELSSVLHELAHDLEANIRAELHRNQMELPLLPLT